MRKITCQKEAIFRIYRLLPGNCIFLAVLLFLFLSNSFLEAASVGSPNELGNRSFEQPLGSGGADSGNWDSTNGAVRVNQASATALGITATLPDGNFGVSIPDGTFTFQVVDGARPGDYVSFRGFAATTIAAANGGRMKIEFKATRGAGDLLISQITSDCVNTGNASASVFTQFTVSGRAPEGTDRIVFTLDRCGGAGAVVFDKMHGTINGFPIELDIEATKNRVPKGGASLATIRVANATAVVRNNIELVVNVPNGLNIVDDGTRLNNEVPIYQGFGARVFTIGSIGVLDDRNLSFLVVVSSGAVIGHRYSVTLYARDSTNPTVPLSQTRTIPIEVIADPFFDEGTIIGKVFDDRNQNGVQDKGEIGISNVRIATEEGIVVLTDRDGKYHIPAVQPGRHLVKIDGHSLPKGTQFITEESYLVKSTEGLLSKVDFAVVLPPSKVPESYRDELAVVVSQGSDFKSPKLEVLMEPEILRIGQGRFEKTPVFRINTNYAGLITSWRIEVKDERGQEAWSGYGLGPPPSEAPWGGTNKSRRLIEPGIYSYRLIVRNHEGQEDWTPLRFFRAVSKLDPASDFAEVKVPSAGFSNLERDGKRNIPIVAKPNIMVRGQTLPGNGVEVNGRPAEVRPDGTFEAEFFTGGGEQTVAVQSISPEGKSVTYHENLEVKDTTFFMVALGEGELGGNKFDGNLETVGRDERFHQGFFQTGRMAYYLKGKIKGKFIVTSRYDTSSDPRHQLFTNLDPDHYYPVYGDSSQINYDARDTQDRLFVLVEMNRSHLKWGSFQTDFNDTEISTYNRTLSGLKLHHEVLSTTADGNSKRGFTFFLAKANQLADHNEFVGTGGSLYYLRNKDAIEGSEKVYVEVRDKIQGIALSQKQLAPGADYEIDYPQGRIILNKPLSSVASSESILANDILDGNQVYLAVDYEFEAQDLFGDQPAGLRGYTYLGDRVRVGGTALKESRQDRDYDLRGVDITVKVGKNTRVAAEFAHSKDAQVRNGVSYNGGITFKNIPTADKVPKKETRLLDDAWVVRGESKPFKNTDVSGYIQRFKKGFSNATSISQKGDEKAGFQVKQKMGEHTSASYRHDRLRNREIATIPEILTDTVQGTYDRGKFLGVAEYRHANTSVAPESARGLEPVFERQEFKHGIGTKLGYRTDNGWMPYLKTQSTIGGKPNQRWGGGIEANVADKGTVKVEQMTGNLGDSARIAFETHTKEGANVYSQVESGPLEDALQRAVTSTIGSSYQVNERSKVYSERELSTYRTGERLGDILGYDFQIDDHWKLGVSGERSRIRDFKDEQEIKNDADVVGDFLNVERTSGAFEVNYTNGERLDIGNRFELRFDRGDTRRYQWLVAHDLEWKLNEDYHFLARLNQSTTRRTSGGGNLDGDFTELNVGLAYRPVAHSRFNFLTRYTWLRDIGVPGQFATTDHTGLQVDEASQIFGIEGTYDLTRWLGLTQKVGYKLGTLRTASAPEWFHIGTFLTVTRLNFHITRKWDIAAEYRIRFDTRILDAVKAGLLFEIDREILDYIRFGVGYNFTDFNDDLRNSNSYTNHGFFSRLTGKF